MVEKQRLEEVIRQIEEIKKSLPAHSVPAAMLLRLEELEEERDRMLSENQGGFRQFGIGFLSTELPQMRTIPVKKSIKVAGTVSLFDQIAELVKTSDPPFAVLECICRKKKQMLDEPCQITRRKETCLALGGTAQTILNAGIGYWDKEFIIT